MLVSPSILSADFAKLGLEVELITRAGADMLHIDIMDGNFVPNISFGAEVVKSIRSHTNIPFDVHLMTQSPEQYIEQFASAGADYITVHYETAKHLDRTINLIKKYNVKAGVALLPTTSPQILEYIIAELDLVLVMSVNPGFSGQQFITSQLTKIQIIRNMLDASKQKTILAVDGGVNDSNINKIKKAGADMVVAGSYIFADKKYALNIAKLKNITTD